MFVLRVTGIGEVSRTLYLLQDRVRHGRTAWQIVGQYLKSRILRDVFGGEQTFYGKAWKPLSDATLMARAYRQSKSKRGRLKTEKGRQRAFLRVFGEARILQDTGLLRSSITARATNNSVQIGTNVSYGRVHQFGSRGRRIPARPFLPTPSSGLPAHDLTRIQQILSRYYTTGETR